MKATTGEEIVNHDDGQYRDIPPLIFTLVSALTPSPRTPHRPPPPSSYFLTRSKEGNFIGRMRKLMIPDIMTSSAEAGRINQSLMTN